MTRMVLGIESGCPYRVDAGSLPTDRVRIGIGGATGEGDITARTSRAVAREVGLPLDVVPGGHAGFLPVQGREVESFAAVLRPLVS